MILKKIIALCFTVLSIIIVYAGCASSQLNTTSQSPENTENQQSPNSPNTYLPQVMINDVVYMLYGDPYLDIEYLPENYHSGQILSTVSLTKKPTMNGEANFDVEVGMPYASYGNGYIVLWNNVWTLFVTENDLAGGIMPTPRIVGGTPEKAPMLHAALVNDNSPTQSVEALQLTTSWHISYEDGAGTGYEADSAHPLQLQQDAFGEATLYLTNVDAKIVLSSATTILRSQ